MSASRLELSAPAKLNLFLHVIGRRNDGMHLLESVFVLIDLVDDVTLELDETGAITRTGDVVGDYSFATPLQEDDLLVFGDMAIYTTCKNNTFNGMPLPPWVPMYPFSSSDKMPLRKAPETCLLPLRCPKPGLRF